MSMSQTLGILDHLQRGHSLTPLEAVDLFGCMRLAARVRDLRRAGYPVESEMVKDSGSGKHYARYRLRRGQAELPGMRRTA